MSVVAARAGMGELHAVLFNICACPCKSGDTKSGQMSLQPSVSAF